MNKIRQIIFQFLPILLVFLFLKYPQKFAELSESGLGKLFAIIVIIFYVSIDRTYGLFVCLLIIAYYQSDFVENFTDDEGTEQEGGKSKGKAKRSKNKDDKDKDDEENSRKGKGGKKDKKDKKGKKGRRGHGEEDDREEDDEEKQQEDENSDLEESVPTVSEAPEIPKDGNIIYAPDLETSQEGFEEIRDVYPTQEPGKIALESRERLCKVHCKNGHLIHKGQIIKPEMTEHIYPNIVSKDRCNICNPSCKFKVLENRFIGKTQEK